MRYGKGWFIVKFRQSGEHTVEIVLTPHEVSALRLNPQEMDCDSPTTRKTLAGLLQKAAKETGFLLDTEEFLIEVSSEQENTVLTLSGICPYSDSMILKPQTQGQPPQTVQVYRFAGSEEAIRGCLRLYETFFESLGENSLYYTQEGNFCLILSLPKKEAARAKGILLEYAEKAQHDTLAAGALEEHAKCFLRKNAVQTLSQYFS